MTPGPSSSPQAPRHQEIHPVRDGDKGLKCSRATRVAMDGEQALQVLADSEFKPESDHPASEHREGFGTTGPGAMQA